MFFLLLLINPLHSRFLRDTPHSVTFHKPSMCQDLESGCSVLDSSGAQPGLPWSPGTGVEAPLGALYLALLNPSEQGLLASVKYFQACWWGKAPSVREQLV